MPSAYGACHGVAVYIRHRHPRRDRSPFDLGDSLATDQTANAGTDRSKASMIVTSRS